MIRNSFDIWAIDIDYSNSTFSNLRVVIIPLDGSTLVQYTSNKILKINRHWTTQFEMLLSMVYKGV